MIYVSSLSLKSKMIIHLAKKTQIILLLAKKVIVPAKYWDFTDIFSKKLVKIFPKRVKINEHAIKLVNSKQIPYKPIYNLRLVKLKTFKTYIKNNLANSFI